MLTKLTGFFLTVTAFFVMIQKTEGLKCFNGTQVIEGDVKSVPITEVDCKKNITVCAFSYVVFKDPTGLSSSANFKTVVRTCANEEATNALAGQCKSVGPVAGLKATDAYCPDEKCNTFPTFNNICKMDLKEPSGESAVRSSISFLSALVFVVVFFGVGDKRIAQMVA